MRSERKDCSPKTLLERIIYAARERRRSESAVSHAEANAFVEELEVEGARILERGRGNANYFLAEIAGVRIALSIFASQKQWWEKPSQGFRSMVKERGCKWGVVLFDLKEKKLKDKKMLWIDGVHFDEHVLKGNQKINFSFVAEAERRRFALRFSTIEEFIKLLSTPTKKSDTPRLIKRTTAH